MPRTIALGDIHGCAAALAGLLGELTLTPADTLVPLGDYIDRGPESARVVELLLSVARQCQLRPLLGNHEIMLLDARHDWRKREFWLTCGGLQTLASYGDDFANIPDAHWQFFEQCLRYWETATHVFVHANYEPHVPLAEQSDEILFWTHLSQRFPPPHASGKVAVVGHTPQPSGAPLRAPHLIGLDTYCVGGKFLTALDVDSGRLWQVNPSGELRRTED